MKSVFLSFAFMMVSSLIMASGVEPTTKNINTANSNIVWKGYKVTGSHEGNIKFKSGALKLDGNKLLGGELVVDMNTIDCTDLQGGGKGKLEGHLKSDDFFGTATHPTATIKFTKIASRGPEGEYKVTANITIKNVTKEIKFNASLKNGVATANLKIDRSDFDIKYGSGSFFDNLGDKAIYDEFDLAVTLNY